MRTNAQDAKLGVTVGLNISHPSNAVALLGFKAGVTSELPLSDVFFSQYGFDFKFQE